MHSIKTIQLAAVVLALATTAALGAPVYRMTVLEPPAPYDVMSADRINNRGDVAGVMAILADYTNSVRAFVRTADGQYQILTLPPELPPSGAVTVMGFNDIGQLIFGDDSKVDMRFFWDPAQGWKQVLPPPDVAYREYFLTGMNGRGDVVGEIYRLGDFRSRNGFTWTVGKGMRIYRPNEPAGFAAVNSRRQVAATVSYPDTDHRPPNLPGYGAARLQLRQDPVHVGDLVVSSMHELRRAERRGYSVASSAFDINEAGSMAVTAQDAAFDLYPCVWKRKAELRCAPFKRGTPIGVGGQDELLFEYNGPGTQWWIWRDGEEAIQLKDALEPGSPPLTSVAANDINEAGELAAISVFPDGVLRSFILTPVN